MTRLSFLLVLLAVPSHVPTSWAMRLPVSTSPYLDGVIDPDNYRAKKEDLIQQKLALKSQKEALQKRRLPLWIERTKDFVKTLEKVGKIDSVEDLNEISSFVQKVGTNRLIADKNVLFD